MPHPFVSILVPVYKVELYIERCARSMFEQTYQNLEYVFVDDGTPDSSIQVLERVINDYPQRADQTHIIHHKCNLGLAAARNTLIANCTGTFICHVDSDDWLERNAIELLVNKQMETGADIVTGQGLIHDEKGKRPCKDGGQGMNRDELLQNLLNHRCLTVLWMRLIRKSLYIDYHIECDYRYHFGEDFQILPQLVWYARSVSSIASVIYHYNRENPNAYNRQIKSNLEYQLQYWNNRRLVSKFFFSKDSFFHRICEETTAGRIHSYMKRWASYGQKREYKMMRDILAVYYQPYWYHIRWNIWLVRMLECNYYTFKSTLPFRRIIKQWM